jgi:DNA-binding CsgD family transcriptional regulator
VFKVDGIDALTASERRVAALAADDLSNKEIAQALFVTVKSVEQHLGRAYPQLDIGSRRQFGDAPRPQRPDHAEPCRTSARGASAEPRADRGRCR